ncbi:MAG: UDP-glucose 4-epimerase [Owenweeksia sp. TMED14]|nr:MAG: UDP-glucose 4-epimerase [Owenweeksia sp. TMED14]
MKRILVTGGLGYIGSHTVVELILRDYDVTVIDNLSNSEEKVLDGIESICGQRPKWIDLDLSDRSRCHDYLKNQKFDGIIHFAAFKAVGESVKKPLKYYMNNIFSLVNLLRYVEKNVNCAFIFSSSCSVYGEAKKLPITEDSEIKSAESPYGNTKQICEEIIEESSVAYNLKSIALRYFNPIGAHPSGKIGELPIGVPQNLVPFITQSAIGIRGELNVWGNDYPTADGSAIRDYIHVVDLAEAHIVALERLLADKNESNTEVYNLGSGKGSSVLEVIEAFKKATGENLPYKISQRRKGDVISAYADTKLAEQKLGWKSKKTLEDALKDAWRWQKNKM